jgi:hypothetical protein
MSWLPVGVVYLACVLQLAIVEIETDAGRRRRGCSARRSSSSTPSTSPARRPVLHRHASFALWRGDVADASRSVDRGWEAVPRDGGVAARRADGLDGRPGRCGDRGRGTPEPPAALRWHPLVSAPTRWSRRPAGSSAPRRADDRRLATGRGGVLATARAYQRRLEGEETGATWRHVALGWAALDAPYDVALRDGARRRRRWHPRPGDRGRAGAQGPLLEAVELGLRLGAKPLLRELRELAAGRGSPCPPAVDAMLDDGATELDDAGVPPDSAAGRASADRTKRHARTLVRAIAPATSRRRPATAGHLRP